MVRLIVTETPQLRSDARPSICGFDITAGLISISPKPKHYLFRKWTVRILASLPSVHMTEAAQLQPTMLNLDVIRQIANPVASRENI
jgi:hypothetical protein